MPIGTRISTPTPRGYLHEERFNSIADPLTREAYLRARLVSDNLGRLPANPAMLAGILYPSMPPKPALMERIIKTWAKAGLVFRYKVGRAWYVEIADNGLNQRLVGNMSQQSEFPDPPEEMIRKWEQVFGLEWKKIQRKVEDKSTNRSNDVETSSDNVLTSSDGVSLKGRESSQEGSQKGVEQKGVEQKGREHDGGVAASAGSLGSPERLTADHDDKAKSSLHEETESLATDHGNGMTLAEWVGLVESRYIRDQFRQIIGKVTNGGFDEDVGFRGYDNQLAFMESVLSCYEEYSDAPYKGLETQVALMSSVVNRCQASGYDAPRGWMKVLSEARRELKGRGPRTHKREH